MFVAKFTTGCKHCGATIHAGAYAAKIPGIGTVHSACAYPAKKAKVAKAYAASAPVAKPAPVQAPAPLPPSVDLSALRTQKAKGIKVLQAAGVLPKAYAYVAQDLPQALQAFGALGGSAFVRPCPVTPRHGFVDSRLVSDPAALESLWAETLKADPQAELILMPLIPASHNMVWRPGMLSIGPGHDGATGGTDSVSVILQPEYAQSWQGIANQAGCDTTKADPFLEAVSGQAHDMVVTQVRAGVKGAPTEPNWCPYPLTVSNVVLLDPDAKADPGAMLAWETTAQGLPEGTAVYNPGGNLGDHWSVHAQIQLQARGVAVAVCTDFKPEVGQALPKMGIDLKPLDPQAIIFGFLGGLVGPSLLDPVARKRAACAAILGTHHGMRMGGDAGVHLGASAAFMLRLGQAALWGEARHKDQGKGLSSGHKLSRDQVFRGVLDNWTLGPSSLRDKVALFFEAVWSGGYGGKAWAACGQATVALDRAMLDLLQDPTSANACNVVTVLTNVVNLAHNNGMWLNKFIETTWYDMAADLDPRVAIMAGPAWYDACTVPADVRMALLDQVLAMAPVDLTALVAKHGDHYAKGGYVATPKTPGGFKATPGAGYSNPYTKTTGKQGMIPTTLVGGTIVLPWEPAKALHKGDHVQIANALGAYLSGEIDGLADVHTSGDHVTSLSGSGAQYLGLTVVKGQAPKTASILAGPAGPVVALLTWA